MSALDDYKAAVAKSGGLVHGKVQLLQAEVDACTAEIDELHKREQCCTCAFVTFEKAEAAAEEVADAAADFEAALADAVDARWLSARLDEEAALAASRA